MKPFHFRLDKVLHYRHFEEKMAQRDLYDANLEVQRRRQEVERIEEEKTETTRRCSDEGSHGMEVARYQIYQDFLRGLGHTMERALLNLKAGEERVRLQEGIMKEAIIKRRILDTLKDKRLKTYQNELAREEQKVIDEMVLRRKGERE